jgi:hypothetical protein
MCVHRAHDPPCSDIALDARVAGCVWMARLAEGNTIPGAETQRWVNVDADDMVCNGAWIAAL